MEPGRTKAEGTTQGEVPESERLQALGIGPGFLRASELGVSAMPTCIFAGRTGPSGAKLGGVTKASFLAAQDG